MRLERMNSPEVEAYFKDHKIALLSVGSIECHGLHNALGTDTLIPMKLLELVEQKSDVLILPTLHPVAPLLLSGLLYLRIGQI